MTLLLVLGLLLLWSVTKDPRSAPGYVFGIGVIITIPGVLSIDFLPLGLGLLASGCALTLASASVKFPAKIVLPLSVIAAVHALPLFIAYGHQGFATNSSLVTIIVAGFVLATGLPVLSDGRQAQAILNIFFRATVLSVASMLVTLALEFLGGMRAPVVGTITSTLQQTVPIRFPFTTYLGKTSFSAGQTFDRWTGLAREPGMMALYCLVALVIAFLWTHGRCLIIAVLMLSAGVLATGSTTGMAIFFACLLLLFSYRLSAKLGLGGRWIHALTIVASIALVPLAEELIGLLLQDKQTRDNPSFSSRTADVDEGLRALSEAPFLGTEPSGQSFSLVGGIAQLGIFYPVLVFLFFIAICRVSRWKYEVTLLAVGVFLTFALTQPAMSSFTPLLVTLAVAYSATVNTRGLDGNSVVADVSAKACDPHGHAPS